VGPARERRVVEGGDDPVADADVLARAHGAGAVEERAVLEDDVVVCAHWRGLWPRVGLAVERAACLSALEETLANRSVHVKRLWVMAAAAVVAAALGLGGAAQAGGSFNKGSCTFNGKKLYGKIQEVTSFPDVKVQVVTSFPDVKVQQVTSFPDSCGKWQFVTAFPDTKVQFVTSFPDVKVQYVTSFPSAN
jgi:hypothetical protein